MFEIVFETGRKKYSDRRQSGIRVIYSSGKSAGRQIGVNLSENAVYSLRLFLSKIFKILA